MIVDKSSDESAVYYDEDILAEQKAILQKIEEINVDDIVIEKPTGQVHEVDLPENPYLLDEQKLLGEQSPFVRKALKQVAKEVGVKWDSRYDNGKYIYDNIANVLGSPKAASQMLEKYGIKGITYDGRQDGRCFVIFDPKDVKVIQKFYQGDETNKKVPPRGAYSDRMIYLFENADASTIVHELGHWFLDDLVKYGKSDKAKEQLQAIYDYLGVKDGVISREQHEYFADSFEVYLKEGVSPNSTLNMYSINLRIG